MPKETDPKDDLLILQEHLRALPPRSKICPSCGEIAWGCHGPFIMPSVIIEKDRVTETNEGISVVVIVCQSCFYLRHYAWEPIRNGQRQIPPPSESHKVSLKLV